MTRPDSLSTKTAPLLHLINQDRASTVSFSDDTVTVRARSGRVIHTMGADAIGTVQLQKLILINRLTVQTRQGQTITVNGLGRETSERLYTQLRSRVGWILDDEASRKAQAIGPDITHLSDSIRTLLSGERYVRHSHSVLMRESTMKLLQRLDKRARQKLAPDARSPPYGWKQQWNPPPWKTAADA